MGQVLLEVESFDIVIAPFAGVPRIRIFSSFSASIGLELGV
jgi:hypothetical protein